ncbi:MrcB family domain-containing protein [Reichenbachiella sp.]|uniref:MrcB family domain-containing protein n=1 Tax=Reichenbachiella sp. TaxID=2184521 RepID=UPI003BB12E2C
MKNILKEPLENYKSERRKEFRNNKLAHKFRHHYPDLIQSLLDDKERYKIVGSSGQGNWADCPWIAILDGIITKTPQSGYYPVYLFRSDMKGVYLSLNQGVTQVKEDYKRDAQKVLKLRAEDYRAKLEYNENELTHNIQLNSKSSNAKLYEHGNILSKYYPIENIPNDETLRTDLRLFLDLYNELAYLDPGLTDDISNIGFEIKKLRLHWRVERSSTLAKKVKKSKGYNCEACGLNFMSIYGEIGKDFIEAHHLTPISELDLGNIPLNIETDFAVLCSNCHSMIHKLEDPSDLTKLRELIKSQPNF